MVIFLILPLKEIASATEEDESCRSKSGHMADVTDTVFDFFGHELSSENENH